MPIDEGKTIEDVEEFVETEQGDPPFAFSQSTFSAVIGRGQSQLVDADLEPGKHALLCFIAMEGGLPHVLLGMIDEAEVLL